MKLFHREFGEGQPLIIVHGLFGSSDNWLSIAKELSGFKVYLPDLRNHGQSPHSDVFTYEAMSEDLNEFLSDHAIDNPVIAGHSMGGKAVMKFAVDHPGLLEKLILVDIAPRFYKRHHDTILEGLNSIDPLKIQSRQEADEILSKYESSFPVRQFLLKNLSREGDSFYWKFNLPVLTEQIENVGKALEEDKSFTKPALFIKGERSKYITDSDVPMIKKIFPASEINVIKNAGHWVHAEQPAAFVEAVRQFVAS